MKNISFKTKMLSGLLTGGILLSSVSTTFAATSNSLNINRKAPLTNECKKITTKINPNIDANLKTLTTVNTLTQDQADKIKAVLKKAKGSKKTNTEKTKAITHQENLISIYSNKINHIDPLTSLVNNGTITQAQADKIIIKQLYLCQDRILHSFG